MYGLELIVERFQYVETWVALISFILCMLFEFILITYYSHKSTIRKDVKDAVKLGNYRLGLKLNSTYEDIKEDKRLSKRIFYTEYKYVYNGVEYKTHVTTVNCEPPRKLLFYWKKNPRVVFSEYDAENIHLNLLWVISPLIICLGVLMYIILKGDM